MLREQRENILESLMTESFLSTESKPLTDSEAKKLKDYLTYVKNYINKKNDKNISILDSNKRFEKRINKFIESSKNGKYSKYGVTIFATLSYKFIPFKERHKHSSDWLFNQILDFYEINKLCNMNPCKDKFSLKLIHHTGDSEYYSLELVTLV